SRPCVTDQYLLPGAQDRRFFWLGQPLAQIEAADQYGELICECELVTRDQLVKAITSAHAANIDDLRRDTRLGMGPCQGGFCTYRAVALWDEVKGQRIASGLADRAHTAATLYAERGVDGSDPPKGEPASAGVALLRHFLQERWKGL